MKSSFRPVRRDLGFSLVELAVYIVVLGIISTIVATVVLSLFRSEQTVSGVSSASNDSQVVSTILGNDIRNARAFKVTPNSVVASVAGSEQILAWKCVRWIISATSDSLIREVLPDGTGIPAWGSGTTLATDVARLEDQPYFSGGSGAVEAGTSIGTLNYSFAFPTTSEGTLAVSGQYSNRLAGAGTTCW